MNSAGPVVTVDMADLANAGEARRLAGPHFQLPPGAKLDALLALTEVLVNIGVHAVDCSRVAVVRAYPNGFTVESECYRIYYSDLRRSLHKPMSSVEEMIGRISSAEAQSVGPSLGAGCPLVNKLGDVKIRRGCLSVTFPKKTPLWRVPELLYRLPHFSMLPTRRANAP